MNKKELRAKYASKRAELKNYKTDYEIQQRLFSEPYYKNCSSIFLTISVDSEIDTTRIIKHALEQNKRVFVPKTDIENKKIIPTEIFSFPDSLISGAYGLVEPVEFPKKIELPELVVVPGLIFSRQGYRIGYGGGYYDRYLKEHNPYTVSLSYDDLILDSIPVDSYDYPVKNIISEKRIIRL